MHAAIPAATVPITYSTHAVGSQWDSMKERDGATAKLTWDQAWRGVNELKWSGGRPLPLGFDFAGSRTRWTGRTLLM